MEFVERLLSAFTELIPFRIQDLWFSSSPRPSSGSQDSKDGLNTSTKANEEDKPPAMPEETGKSKVVSWLNQGLKAVSRKSKSEY